MSTTDNTRILASVREKLEECRGTWVEVARASGVPYHTLTKIAQGQVPDPRISTVQRLVDHFNGAPRAPEHAEAAAKAA
jgi:predicted transcriptional regulator